MRLRSVFFIFPILLLASCEGSDDSVFDYANNNGIYSEDGNISLRELVFFLKPYRVVDGQKQYLLTDSIYNVQIEVNETSWGSFTSLDVDTSAFDYNIEEDISTTHSEIKYAIVAPYFAEEVLQPTTAGGFSDLVNNYFTLLPGNYIFQVSSFDFTANNGEAQTINTYVVSSFEVLENSRSVFVGEFEIELN